MSRKGFVYILASGYRSTLYVCVTNNLARRVSEHKAKLILGFSNKHNLNRLVYYEIYNKCIDALLREKQLKRWRRSWKIRIIEEDNPFWNDLSYVI